MFFIPFGIVLLTNSIIFASSINHSTNIVQKYQIRKLKQEKMTNERKEVMTVTKNENEFNELRELRESNANLIAERENLMEERKQLQEKISELEKKLGNVENDTCWVYSKYNKEKDKVRSLALIIKAMKCDESISAVVERICDMV